MKYFIQSLQDDVHIVEALPAELANIEPVTKAPISWSKVILEKLALVIIFRQCCRVFITICVLFKIKE